MIRTEKRMRLCLALLVCCLVFIWGNSLLPGEVSGAISDEVKEILETLFPGEAAPPAEGGFLLRKAAHFTEFTALGLCLGWLFGMLGRGLLPPLGWGVAAACVDETIQMFVPDRGPSLRDVGIDSGGVLLGLLLLIVGHAVCKKMKSNSEEIQYEKNDLCNSDADDGDRHDRLRRQQEGRNHPSRRQH